MIHTMKCSAVQTKKGACSGWRQKLRVHIVYSDQTPDLSPCEIHASAYNTQDPRCQSIISGGDSSIIRSSNISGSRTRLHHLEKRKLSRNTRVMLFRSPDTSTTIREISIRYRNTAGWSRFGVNVIRSCRPFLGLGRYTSGMNL